MGRSERFGLVLSPAEKLALERLAEQERLPAAAVVRRLIWERADRRGLLPADDRHSEARAKPELEGS